MEVEGEEEFEVAEILDSKLDKWYRHCPLRYYIQWRGYEGTDEEFSWIGADELHADEILDLYHERYPDKPGPLEET